MAPKIKTMKNKIKTMKEKEIKKRSGTSYNQLKAQLKAQVAIAHDVSESLKCSHARENTLEKELTKAKANAAQLNRDLVDERVHREDMVDIKIGGLRRLKAPPSLSSVGRLSQVPSQVLDPLSLGRIAGCSGGYISAGASTTGNSTPPRGGRR